jgi:hypothetical protein
VLIPVFQDTTEVASVWEGNRDSKVHRLANRGGVTTKKDIIPGWQRDIRVAVAPNTTATGFEGTDKSGIKRWASLAVRRDQAIKNLSAGGTSLSTRIEYLASARRMVHPE